VRSGRSPAPRQPSDLTDQWQNLLRWAGDLPTARKVITTWEIADGERSPLPALRLGEVAFLQHDYNEAAAHFDIAARRTRLVHYDNDLAVDQAQLNRGAALFAAGRNAEAIALLRPLVHLGTQGYAFQTTKRNIDGAASFAAVSYYAAEQLPTTRARATTCTPQSRTTTPPSVGVATERLRCAPRGVVQQPRSGRTRSRSDGHRRIPRGQGTPLGSDGSRVPDDGRVHCRPGRQNCRGGRLRPTRAAERPGRISRRQRLGRGTGPPAPRLRGRDRPTPGGRRQSKLCAGLVQSRGTRRTSRSTPPTGRPRGIRKAVSIRR
jgi:hypothetical protein